ncbi:MAG: glycosyltransferase [bacterium]|nr:glycosyltransferase [bacterium]
MPPVRVLHFIDAALTWDQRVALNQLLDRLPEHEFEQHVASLGPRSTEGNLVDHRGVVIANRLRLDFLAAPELRRTLVRRRIDLVHAWGQSATRVTLTAAEGVARVVSSVFEPTVAHKYAKLLQAGRSAQPPVLLCATEIVRRCLLERGVGADTLVLLRPGVDFAAVNRTRASDLRSELGLSPTTLALLSIPAPCKDQARFSAFWATAVRSFLDPDIRLLLPGETRETSRLQRLAGALRQTHVPLFLGDRYRTEELIATADILLAPSGDDRSTTELAWAMGAGVAIIATATHSAAELLAHGHSAFLIKPDSPKRLAMRVAEALGHRHEWRSLTDTARAQAYDMFSVRRCIDQTRTIYRNLLNGQPAENGLLGPAVA